MNLTQHLQVSHQNSSTRIQIQGARLRRSFDHKSPGKGHGNLHLLSQERCIERRQQHFPLPTRSRKVKTHQGLHVPTTSSFERNSKYTTLRHYPNSTNHKLYQKTIFSKPLHCQDKKCSQISYLITFTNQIRITISLDDFFFRFNLKVFLNFT